MEDEEGLPALRYSANIITSPVLKDSTHTLVVKMELN